MNRHAYLVVAHNNWRILKLFLRALDKPEHDFFLHVDSKSADFNESEFENMLTHSRVYLIDRKSLIWADYSQFEVTLDLLEYAKATGEYTYYHLISGADMPLKPAEEIYSFFENSGREFIAIVPKEFYYCIRRTRFYHPLVNCKRFRKSKFLKVADRLLEYAQKAVGVNRLKGKELKIINGWTWVSITNSFCEYVLSKKDEIYSTFHSTIASDELVFQTLIYNSDFYKDIYCDTDLKKGSMRFIDWERGRPYTWGQEDGDFETLINSPYMFARKFDEKVNFDIVERIYDYVTKNKDNQ